jgi:hypothetical protein
MGWIRWTGKTLEFAGKLVQAKSFEDWAEGQGKALVEKLGVEAGGVVLGFGTAKKGRSIVWGELRNVAENSPSLAAAINMAASQYPGVFDNLARSAKVPYLSSDLAVVPRFLIRRDILAEITAHLQASQELEHLKGGGIFRDYFLKELASQADDAFVAEASKASPDKPLQIKDRWVVGFDKNYMWQTHPGHFLVFYSNSGTRPDASRSEKKSARARAAAQMQETLAWLGTLTKEQRQELEAKFP